MTRDKLCFSVMLASFVAGFVSIAAMRLMPAAPWTRPVFIAAVIAWALSAVYYFVGTRK
ncbi:MAG: hypothetical protein JSR25_10655 [Proteobacteria bacterium]|nr:hypothetical protein [Pseudomonadota bacterium]